MNILIYTVGDKQSGFGHIHRQSVLARELVRRGHKIEFITFGGTSGATRITQLLADLPEVMISAFVTDKDVSSYIKDFAVADVAILDVEHGPSRNLLKSSKNNNRKVVVIGGVGFPLHDPHSIDELVDLQIYQGVALNSMSRDNSVSNMLVGPEYVIVDPEFLAQRSVADKTERSGILVSMGGSDPHGITGEVVFHLTQISKEPIAVVIGPGMYPAFANFERPVEVIYQPASLAPHMARHKYLVTALGMTVYEALCLGIPVACTAWSKDHEETAWQLHDRQCVKYLGMWNDINWEMLKMFCSPWDMYQSGEVMRERMVERGRALIDGLGVRRVASAIEEL